MTEAPHKISVIVGAEGGFTREEIEFALKLGAKPISLGKRILRSETAAIYTTAIVMAILDESD
jgi:16S rRNA (uracil1498-N3)-methyltransferase